MRATIVQRDCTHFLCLLKQHEKALQVAQQAVGTVPDSATAQIALAYAPQVRFDLAGAHQSC